MAQRRRQEKQMKQRQRVMTLLCIAGGLGAMLLSLVVCLMIFDLTPKAEVTTAPAASVLPYDANTPFALSDLTPAQMNNIRQNGRIVVSDGPRGISIGDTLEEVFEKFPSTFTEKLSSSSSNTLSDEEMLLYCEENIGKLSASEQTGLQSNEEMILYCAEYFENQNGIMTALPPRGLVTVDNGSTVVTLLAPTTAYPAGTKDSYGSYEHVYCVFTIEPDTMTIASIILGIDR